MAGASIMFIEVYVEHIKNNADLLNLGFVLVYLQVVKLLAYISDKDLFAEFYR